MRGVKRSGESKESGSSKKTTANAQQGEDYPSCAMLNLFDNYPSEAGTFHDKASVALWRAAKVESEADFRNVIGPLFAAKFSAYFDSTNYTVTKVPTKVQLEKGKKGKVATEESEEEEKDRKSMWAIAKHNEGGWYLEFQCEASAEECGEMSHDGIKREAKLRIPPSRDHPDMMVSCILENNIQMRLPLWIIGLKYRRVASGAWGQAHSYGFQALRHNRSVLPTEFKAVRTSSMNHLDRLGVESTSWEVCRGL